MGLNHFLRKRHNRLLFFTSMYAVLSIAFTNCGQSGSLAIAPPEQQLQAEGPAGDSGDPDVPVGETTGDPGVIPPPGFPQNYRYVAKSKSISVDAVINNKVDLLIVIDNSGSMATEQKNMADRFSYLLEQLQGLDWQVGIITTDVSSDKNLKDGRIIEMVDGARKAYIINSKMSLVESKSLFAKAIQRPEEGSGNEQGIKATYRAIERALDPAVNNVNKPNRDLIRAGAALAVLVVSDANETPGGDIEARNDGDELFKYVTDSWAGKKKFVFNAIVVKSGDSVCKGKNGNEAYGVAYEALATKTGGIIGDVCATDYGKQLKVIGEKLVNQVRSIQLDCAPVDSNGDGVLDIVVRQTSVTMLTPAMVDGYAVTGAQLLFANYLSEGVYVADYVCKELVTAQ